MSLKMPESMDDCLYFTRRELDDESYVFAWVYKKKCPKCKKADMGKPVDPKTKKVKIRAIVYECPECGYSEPKKEHEESLDLEAKYLCPVCRKEGESTAKYKRKKYKGVDSFIVECAHCGEKIPLTKKLKGI